MKSKFVLWASILSITHFQSCSENEAPEPEPDPILRLSSVSVNSSNLDPEIELYTFSYNSDGNLISIVAENTYSVQIDYESMKVVHKFIVGDPVELPQGIYTHEPEFDSLGRVTKAAIYNFKYGSNKNPAFINADSVFFDHLGGAGISFVTGVSTNLLSQNWGLDLVLFSDTYLSEFSNVTERFVLTNFDDSDKNLISAEWRKEEKESGTQLGSYTVIYEKVP